MAMAGLLQATTGLFGGLNLRCKHNLRVSNGTAARLCMKTTAPNYHVEVRRLRAEQPGTRSAHCARCAGFHSANQCQFSRLSSATRSRRRMQ